MKTKCSLKTQTSAVIDNTAGVAQLVEQLICNQQVAGSSPFASSARAKGSCAPPPPQGAGNKTVVDCPSG